MKGIVSSVIIPIFQEINIFKLFLYSLHETIQPKSQIIFINDDSGDQVQFHIEEFIKKQRNNDIEVEYVRHSYSKGCPISINEGIKVSKGKYLFFIDSDVILESGWQIAMLDTLSSNKKIGITGPLLLYPQTGGVQHCGIAFSEDIGRHLFLNADPETVPKDIFKVQSVIFALCGVKRSVIEKIGGLDEMYFNGYEDLDFQMRAIKAGFDIVVNPAIRSYHWEQGNGIHRAINRKNNLGRFWKKWGNQIRPDLWSFLLDNLKKYVLKSDTSISLIAIDLAEVRADAYLFWQHIKRLKEIKIKEKFDYSYKVETDSPICLPKILDETFYLKPNRFLFLVDNFVKLLGNKYWIGIRRLIQSNDIVIDLYGNVLELDKVFNASWPGSKIR